MFGYLGPDPPITLWLPVIPQLGFLPLSGKQSAFFSSPFLTMSPLLALAVKTT